MRVFLLILSHTYTRIQAMHKLINRKKLCPSKVSLSCVLPKFSPLSVSSPWLDMAGELINNQYSHLSATEWQQYMKASFLSEVPDIKRCRVNTSHNDLGGFDFKQRTVWPDSERKKVKNRDCSNMLMWDCVRFYSETKINRVEILKKSK